MNKLDETSKVKTSTEISKAKTSTEISNEKTNISLGQLGEEKAAKYLISKGYDILCRNFRCKLGEIDIVARNRTRKNAIVFFEVKTRTNCEFGLPCESVTPAKIKKLKSVIKTFAAYYNYLDNDLCIDIIEILMLDDRAYIRHLENVT